MADLSEMLAELLSSDEGKQQISQMKSMLSQSSNSSGGQANNSNNNGNNGGMPDLSALLSSLGGGGGQNNNNNGNSGGMPDLSALLSSLMGGGNNNSNNNNNNNNNGGMPDFGSLLSSLGGGGNNNNSGNFGLPNLDIGKLLKVQKLLSQRKDDSSTALLRALKPHLSEENRKKVDEAVRIMELLDLLPLIKESGLLGSLLGGDGG